MTASRGFTPYNNCDRVDSISPHQGSKFRAILNSKNNYPCNESARNCNRSCIAGFTLIELLIVIAILVVLSVAVVVILNPAELLRQARDSTRISDLASVNSAIALYLAD